MKENYCITEGIYCPLAGAKGVRIMSKIKELDRVVQLKSPPLEKIERYKTYGNKYVKFWCNTITRDKYIIAVVCGEQKTLPETQDGLDQMEKWINEKRTEIAKALKLCEVQENC